MGNTVSFDLISYSMRFLLGILLLAGCSYSASVVCTKFAKDVSGGGAIKGYYVRPIPGNCRAQHLGNWRPNFRIREPWSNCRDGFRKYRNACYRLARGNHNINFRDGEQICNRHQGHIMTFKDRQEFMWIHNHIANQNKWYWVGIFCGRGNDIRNAYTVTGEDMRKIAPRWGFKGHQGINMHSHPCYMWHRNNGHWIRHFHHRHCHEGHGTICKSP